MQTSETSQSDNKSESLVPSADGREPSKRGVRTSGESPRKTFEQFFAESETKASNTSDDANSESGESHEDEEISDLDSLAKRLKVKPEDLYSKLKIAMGTDGKQLTLGEIKDVASKATDLTRRELEFQERHDKSNGELIRARSEIRELISAIPEKALKPEVLNVMRERHETYVKAQRAETLRLIPDWKDEKVRTEEMQGMLDHLKEYGFNTSDFTTIEDARYFNYIRAMYKLQTRVRKAMEQVKLQDTATRTAPAKTSGKSPRKQSESKHEKPQSSRSKLERLFKK